MISTSAPISGALVEADKARTPWYANGWAVVACIAAARLVLYGLTANKYGYFRDELYYIACSEHLGWGYTDHPPMIAFITWAARHLFGDSLWSLRLFPALAGMGTIVLAAAIARELGGRRLAMALAAIGVLVAPVYLLLDYLLTMNAFEPLFWMGCAFTVIRAIKRQEPKYWLWFGVLAGFGLLNKYSTAVFGLGIVAGLLLTPARRFLRSKWLWLGGVVALLILSPNIIWNAVNHWPFIEWQKGAGHDFGSRTGFLVQQVLGMNPVAFPLWLLGLWWLFFSRDGKPYRLFGWTYVVVLGTFFVTHGKLYYPMPVYPLLLAAGGVATERLIERSGRGWLKEASIGALIAGGVWLAPTALPLLSVEGYVRYQEASFLKAPRTERSHYLAALPQYFADQFGWEEMTAAVARIYNGLPLEERRQAAIIGNNFGECGAIDFFGQKYGLPKSIGVAQSYHLWGPRGYHGEVLIVLGDRPAGLRDKCREVVTGAELNHPWAEPWENRSVLVCRGLKWDLQEVWPKLKRY